MKDDLKPKAKVVKVKLEKFKKGADLEKDKAIKVIEREEEL